eukprot:366427-Chlamydomonas_euryale.AAC.8
MQHADPPQARRQRHARRRRAPPRSTPSGRQSRQGPPPAAGWKVRAGARVRRGADEGGQTMYPVRDGGGARQTCRQRCGCLLQLRKGRMEREERARAGVRKGLAGRRAERTRERDGREEQEGDGQEDKMGRREEGRAGKRQRRAGRGRVGGQEKQTGGKRKGGREEGRAAARRGGEKVGRQEEQQKRKGWGSWRSSKGAKGGGSGGKAWAGRERALGVVTRCAWWSDLVRWVEWPGREHLCWSHEQGHMPIVFASPWERDFK